MTGGLLNSNEVITSEARDLLPRIWKGAIKMLVVMENNATRDQVERVVAVIEEMGYTARPMPGEQRTAIGLVGNDGRVDSSRIESLSGVAEVIHVTKPYKQVSREWKAENTIVTIAPGVSFCGSEIPIIAGPFSVVSEQQIVASA